MLLEMYSLMMGFNNEISKQQHICHALMIKESGFILLSNDTLSLSNIWHPKLIFMAFDETSTNR